MSDGLNRVILLGNLGQDPDLRYTAAGLPVLSLRIATNESFVDRNKELQQRTEWHSVVLFGARAEGLARLLGKGSGVLVEGGLRTSNYEKDGVKRTKTEVLARDVCITGRRAPIVPHDDEPLPAPPPAIEDDAAPGGPDVGENGGHRSVEAPAPERPHRNGKGSRAQAPNGRVFVDELPF